MNTRLLISLLCAGALAFACGPRSHSDAPASLASALPIQAASMKAAVSSVVGHSSRKSKGREPEARIDSRLNVSVAQRDVHFALAVRNVGSKHAEIDFPNGQSYDFVVVDSIGKEVWRWSHGHLFTQGVKNKQLGAGDAMTIDETWKESVKPGRYTAIATLRSSNYPVEQRVDFVMQ